MKSFRITAPFLSDEERKAAATGYDGPPANTDALLGTWDPSTRKIGIDPVFAGLQTKHVYAGTVDRAAVERRRKRNKAARQARKAQR